jgi:hypothetical protein
MAMLFEIAGSLIAIGGISVLGYVYFGGRRRADQEQGLQPLYREQCGGYFDGWCFTAPFFRLAIYDRFIVVAYGGTRYVLQASDIQEIAVKRHLLSRGIHIERCRAGVPHSFIIWSCHPDRVMKALGRQNADLQSHTGERS